MHTEHHSFSPEETQQFAESFSQQLEPGSVLALHGELGAGKTCFVQGLAQGLHVSQLVNSPTFTIVHEYQGDLPIYHIDFYRIASEDEALDLGLDEYVYGNGITAIEWPERVESLLPSDTYHIHLLAEQGESSRTIKIERCS